MQTLTLEKLRLSERDFRKISDIVYQHCGINLHEEKKELVRARLAKLLRMGNFKNFSDYLRYVREDKTGREFSVLIDALSTNLTSFFRENKHCEFLNSRFLPSLLERKQNKGDFRLRAWSAGCSSGEEPYSIAITLFDAVKGLCRWDAKILATDISISSLETARKGIYDQKRVEPVPPVQKHKYLTSSRVDGRKIFEVNRSLRDAVTFSYLNLMESWPIKGPLDFIFCRNVMIYFDKPTQERLVNRFWDILDSGGVLFTGHSESLTGINHKFNYIEPTIYMKS